MASSPTQNIGRFFHVYWFFYPQEYGETTSSTSTPARLLQGGTLEGLTLTKDNLTELLYRKGSSFTQHVKPATDTETCPRASPRVPQRALMCACLWR